MVSSATSAATRWWLFLPQAAPAVPLRELVLMGPGATIVVLRAFVAASAHGDGLVTLVRSVVGGLASA